jgi:hypothetical protein
VSFISPRVLAATAALILMVDAGSARADVVFSSFLESTFTVSGPGNNAFCSGTGSGGTCDFKGGTGGNGAGSVNAPNIASTTSTSSTNFQPTLASNTPTIIGQNGGVLQWWTVGNYANATSVAQGSLTNSPLTDPSITSSGTTPLFSNTSFFPPGGNDTSTFLTAEFTGKVTVGTGDTLSFTGSVDDNVLIYVRTDGSSGAYTLLPITPDNLSNQPAFTFNSNTLGSGSYDFEIFYADRSSTQASLTLDAVVTAPVPEASTWAMMVLGFFGLGFMAYRKGTLRLV